MKRACKTCAREHDHDACSTQPLKIKCERMKEGSKIYIAGHNGLVGSAILKNLMFSRLIEKNLSFKNAT